MVSLIVADGVGVAVCADRCVTAKNKINNVEAITLRSG